jgi:D-2-hydroxyacid dehydrogenase (NADP+)
MKIWIENSYLKDENIKYFKNEFKDLVVETNFEYAKDSSIAIIMPNFANKTYLDQMPNLKMVQLLTAGFDQLDLNYFKSRNILLAYAKDVFSIQIAEDIFSKILYFNRNLNVFHEQMKQKTWKYMKVNHEIYGSTIGIIGAGSIGIEVAKRMKAFQTKVYGYKKTLENLDYFDQVYNDRKGLEKILKESDYIIISIALSKETYHLIGNKELELMKDSALLINVARGDVIDQEALYNALKHKTIRGAGLDVTSPEPLPSENLLWSLDNILITPHNASSSPYVNLRLIHQVKNSIHRYLKNEKLDNIVKL